MDGEKWTRPPGSQLPNMELKRVMIIAEQVPEETEQIREAVEVAGYSAQVVESVYRTLETVRQDRPDLLVVRDDFLIEGGGWVIAEQVWEIAPGLPVVVLKSSPAHKSPTLVDAGPYATLDTPVKAEELQATANRLLGGSSE